MVKERPKVNKVATLSLEPEEHQKLEKEFSPKQKSKSKTHTRDLLILSHGRVDPKILKIDQFRDFRI